MLQNADCCLLVWGGVLSRHYVPGRSQKKKSQEEIIYTWIAHALHETILLFMKGGHEQNTLTLCQ